MRFRPVTGIAAMLACFIAMPSYASELKDLAACSLSPPFHVEGVDELRGAMRRELETENGTDTVLIQDGFRILVTAQNRPFANIKAEAFSKETFDHDLKLSIASISHLAKQSDDMPKTVFQKTIGNQEFYWIERNVLHGGVLNITLVVDRDSHIISTIYLLNDEPADRVFNSLAEFDKLRDSFFSVFASCRQPHSSKKT